MKRLFDPRLVLKIVLFLLILERAALFFTFPPIIELDSYGYKWSALSIASGEKLYNPANRTPGYLVFLAGIYKITPNDGLTVFIQSILGFILILLIMALLETYTQKILAGLFFLLNFSMLRCEHSVLADLILVFLVVLAFVYLKRFFENRRILDILAVGAVTGYALMTKPIMMLYPVLILFVLFLDALSKNEKPFVFFRNCFVFLIPVVLMWGAWSYHNYRNTKYFGMTPVLGVTLSTMLEDYIDLDSGVHMDIKKIIRQHSFSEKTEKRFNLLSRLIPEILEKTKYSYVDLNSKFMDIAKETLKKHPFALLGRGVRETPYFWLTTDSVLVAQSKELNEPGMLNNFKKGNWGKAFTKFFLNGYVPYFILLTFFFVFWVRSIFKSYTENVFAYPLNIFILLNVLYVMSICVFLQYGTARYRLVIEPFMVLCACAAIGNLITNKRERA
jgi:4-amino-4-deoxy-L-arabinose transferase-like glycosyltransferase